MQGLYSSNNNIAQNRILSSKHKNTSPILSNSQHSQSYSVNFKSQNQAVTTSVKKEGLSTAAKWGIGIASSLLVAIGGAIAFVKYQPKLLEQFYKKNLVKVNLAEKIEFKKAGTIEEAIEFAKKTLGIKKVDKNFSLEALNDVNKALVDVSNANKGSFYQFKKLKMSDKMPEGAIAATDQGFLNFGTLIINSKSYDEKYLKDSLQKMLFGKNGNKLFMETKSKKYIELVTHNNMMAYLDEEVGQLVKKFYNKEAMTIEEMRILERTLFELENKMRIPLRNPLHFFKNNKAIFEKEGINIDLDKLAKMNAKEQKEFLRNTIAEYNKTKKHFFIEIKKHTPADNIYHEAGHMQDFGKNLKEIQVKNATVDLKSKEPVKDMIKDRWGSIESDEELCKLFKESPEKFKKEYPNLYEFIKNEKTQQTAGLISGYARTGIGEFIAETYAKLVKGEKLADDVLALYKKYNGPLLP